jgi:hypothetical protein
MPQYHGIEFCHNQSGFNENEGELEPGLSYRAFYFNPAAEELPAGTAAADATGTWQPPVAPVFQDWVLVLDHQ